MIIHVSIRHSKELVVLEVNTKRLKRRFDLIQPKAELDLPSSEHVYHVTPSFAPNEDSSGAAIFFKDLLYKKL